MPAITSWFPSSLFYKFGLWGVGISFLIPILSFFYLLLKLDKVFLKPATITVLATATILTLLFTFLLKPYPGILGDNGNLLVLSFRLAIFFSIVCVIFSLPALVLVQKIEQTLLTKTVKILTISTALIASTITATSLFDAWGLGEVDAGGALAPFSFLFIATSIISTLFLSLCVLILHWNNRHRNSNS